MLADEIVDAGVEAARHDLVSTIAKGVGQQLRDFRRVVDQENTRHRSWFVVRRASFTFCGSRFWLTVRRTTHVEPARRTPNPNDARRTSNVERSSSLQLGFLAGRRVQVKYQEASAGSVVGE